MKTESLLRTPIQEWPLRLQSQKDLQEVEHELAALIQRATLMHAYVAHRWNTGCGAQPHSASAKKANRTLVQVRKALGFSYPKSTGISIQ